MFVDAMGSLFVVLITGVFSSLTVSTLYVDESLQRELHRGAPGSGGTSGERTKRNASSFPQGSGVNSSQPFGDKIFWRDNNETRRLGNDGFTVTRVLYHGIYPSLNVTEPVRGAKSPNRSVRAKRDSTGRDMRLNNLDSDLSPQLNSSSNIPPMNNTHYVRADHPKNSTNSRFYTSQNLEDPIVLPPKYRTLYYPAKNSSEVYRGDPENRGRVRLISVGYYSFNESRDGERSFRNFKRRQREDEEESTATNDVGRPRWRRDTSGWTWVLSTLGIGEEDNSVQRNEIGSEPVVEHINEERQQAYGYSSSGYHSHPVPSHPEVLPPAPTSYPSSTPPTVPDDRSTSFPPLPQSLPRLGPVLIQAPVRRINCTPPKRLARGRCRTVWRQRI